MLGAPLFQILFFTYLGRYAGSQDDDFFIVGNAIQVSAQAGIYGMTMGIANERQYGTLQPLLATPANRLAMFSGRALPFIANGLIVSTFGFCVAWLFLDFSPAPGSIPPLAVAVVITTCSCVALGMVIGSIGLRARDVFFGANLVYFLMLLVCGVNIATAASEVGKTASFGVRPEDLQITTGDDFLFQGTVSIVEALGEVTLLYIDGLVQGEPIIAKIPGILDVKRGETVRFTADRAKLHLFDAAGKSYRTT